MPSTDLGNRYFCRIDGPKEWLEEKCKIMSAWIDCKTLLAAHHLGEKKENPHCHFVIELTTTLQRQTFNKRLKALFQLEKKSDWSTNTWTDDGACSYLFHEKDECILVNKGHTDDDIARYRKLNADVQKVVQANKGRGPSRIVDRVLELPFVESWDRRRIARELFDFIRRGEMYEPGDFKLKAIIEEIYLKSRPKEEWTEYCEERCNRLFRFDER